jgi:DNA repair protein RadC
MNSIDLFHQNIAEVKISYSHKVRPSEMKKISCSRDAYEIMLLHADGKLDHIEYFWAMLLTRHNNVLGIFLVSQGGLSGTVADPKVIFQAALKSSSNSLILCHNHPSGQTKPSDADLKLTRQLVEAGKMLDLPVMDHVIISSESYFSFANEGIL